MINEILHFIKENYDLIILIAACILDLVLFLVGVFKKRKNSTLEDVFHMIPAAIYKTEEVVGAGNGEKKKRLVMDLACKWYKELTGVELVEGSRYWNTISEFVEEVLITPTKKGK